MPFAAKRMDVKITILSEVSQIGKNKYGVLKRDANELFTKQKLTHRHTKQTYGYRRGKRGRDKLGIGDLQIGATIYKINNKNLLITTGNYIQYLVITYNGKKSKNKYICV